MLAPVLPLNRIPSLPLILLALLLIAPLLLGRLILGPDWD